jgi:phosphoglycerate kinase
VAALNVAGVVDRLTYVSTAGGAFLEWLEGKALPGVEVLRIK